MPYVNKLDLVPSSISSFTSAKDFSADNHFKWVSIRIFLYFTFVHSSHIYHTALFSKLYFTKVNIFNFVTASLFVGIPYMCADVFIKQYTRRIDFNEALSPLLKGITISILIQTTMWKLTDASDAGDAARYLFTSLYGSTVWSRCHINYNHTECIMPVELLRRCAKHHRIHINTTSAHINYISQFGHHDRAIITTRFFVNALLWILNFFISNVSDGAILKFYKIIFWWGNVSTMFTLLILMVFTNDAMKALSQIMDVNSDTSFGETLDEVGLIYGVGTIGVYELGTMSPYTMIDNAVVIFSVIYILVAFIRSMIVRILYLGLVDCVDVDYNTITPHYINFALLPLSTEFLYGQRLYTTYLYLNVMLTIVAYLTLFTLTMTKILHMQFRSVKNVYIVGILCVLGFIMSVPIVLIQHPIFKGFLTGQIANMFILGSFRMAIIMWIYGTEKFSTDIHFWLGFKPTSYWTLSWLILPAVLLIRCAMILYYMTTFPSSTLIVYSFGWFVALFLIVIVFQMKTIVYYLLHNNLIGAFKSSKKYGPPDAEDRLLRRNYNSATFHRLCLHDCMVLDEGIDCNHLPLMQKERNASFQSPDSSLEHLFEAGPSKMPSTINTDFSHLD